MCRRILDRAACLVRELAEVHLEGVRRGGEHVDVRPGAEDSRVRARDHDDLHGRMLEPQALDGVGELDVDAEVVGVQLELVPGPERPVRVDVQQQARDGAVDVELPVRVAARIGFEVTHEKTLYQRRPPGRKHYISGFRLSLHRSCSIVHTRCTRPAARNPVLTSTPGRPTSAVASTPDRRGRAGRPRPSRRMFHR